ncbi:MAG: type II secretion system F family protein [Syntrophothermus sp.]|uniref:type II secretion system F family protein n=1 Tax=Syntrophothermus sp. TaxID=2736299 RepID=UPI00257A3FC4|nr:type II secretion system F family protein [Syntrophothermus sp.]NSW83604.1 type II secretion system F family protein [Syntrophothermus sp.]
MLADISKIHLLIGLLAFCAVLFGALGWRARRRETNWLMVRLRQTKTPKDNNIFTPLQKTAEKAGLKIKPAHLVAAAVTGCLVGAGFGLAVTGRKEFALIGLAAGLLAPYAYVKRLVQGRREAFEMQFEQCLRKMASAMRAGMSVGQAVAEAAKTAEPPAGEVLQEAVRLASAGFSLTRAVETAAGMVDSRDMELMASSVALHMQVGGNLAEVFDRIADNIRDRQSYRARVAAATSEGRLTANVLTVLPFLTVAAMRKMSPVYMWPLFNTSAGIKVFAVCSVMIIAGWFFLKQIAAAEDI